MSSESTTKAARASHNGAGGEQPLPLEGSWRVAAERSRIGFRVKKMGIYHVKGHFREVEGTAELGPASAGGEVVIKAASVSTRVPPRDAHLRSRDFLDAGSYPEIRVSAPSIEVDPQGRLVVPTFFDLHGKRAPVQLSGHAHAHGSGEQLVLHLAGSLDRHVFGIRPRQPFEMVVGDEVLVDVELVLERR